MMHTFTTRHSINTQSGVSVVTAIFLVVILSLMGLGMIVLLTTSHQSVIQEIGSAKSYMAGRTCLQWGMYQAIFSPGTATGTHTTIFNDVDSGINNTRCISTFTSITNDGLSFYTINVTASFGDTNSPEFSRRRLQLKLQP